jgi:hypothetical protein
MDYRQTMKKAQTLLEQGHHAQAVQVAGSALEHLLVDLYHDLLRRVPPERQKALVAAQEQVAQTQPLDRLVDHSQFLIKLHKLG